MTDERAVAPGARNYSWPPFEPGHELSTKHGAYSERKVDPIALELVDELRQYASTAEGQHLGYVLAPQHRHALLDWARTEARIVFVSEWLLEHGELDGEDDVRPAANLLVRLQRLVLKQRSELGLSPAAEASLAKARAGAELAGFDLQAALAAARERQAIDAQAGDSGGIKEAT